MLTTTELRLRFDGAFSKIVKTLSPELQKKWDGTIVWKDEHSYPDIQVEIIQQLSPSAKASYISLLNKLSRGKI